MLRRLRTVVMRLVTVMFVTDNDVSGYDGVSD